MIEHVDDVSNASEEYKKRTQILDVIKTAAYIKEPLSDENVEKAINKAQTYGLDVKNLKLAIQTLQDRILDEM